MTETENLEATNRRIAADLLLALIAHKHLQPGGATSGEVRARTAVQDTVKAYELLLRGISGAKNDA